jgi:hypothetical protein
MTLRIDPVRGRVRISGDFRLEHLDQIKGEIERSQSPVVLDLEELNLVDVECVRFLNECEAKGVSLVHCSPFLRTWMSQERKRTREGTPRRSKGQAPFGQDGGPD